MTLHREMNRLFDDVFRGQSLTSLGEGEGSGVVSNFINSNINVSETENEFRITAELPGVTEQDIDVRLEDDVITIQGEKKFEQSQGDEKENFHFVERSYGTFRRSLRLPATVDPEQVTAKFEHGVLTITLPKTAQEERSRKIQIEAATASGKPDSGNSQQQGSDKRSGAKSKV
jgi:HSP20 family protein